MSVSIPATLVGTGGSAVTRQVHQFTAATGGTGRGFFADTTVVGNTTSRDQALGDIDNDGDLDLITTGALYGCRIFLNNGSGQYTFKTGTVAGQTPSGVVLADVDQDGDLDMLVSDATNSTVAVCLNDGTGEFIDAITGAQNAPVGARPEGLAIGDVDGDGDLDFATANADGNSATIRFNTGTLPLLYTSAITVAVGAGPTAVALADIDNDGDLDLLTANAGTASNPVGSVSVSRNSGTGTFGASTSVAVGLAPSELALADIDGDGDLDLLTANAGSASLSVRLNNGSGTFTGTTTLALPAGSTPSGLRTGDLDADGDLDVVVAQGRGGRLFTCLNTAGTFAVQARALRLNRDATAQTVRSEGVVLGDVDGDLDLDLITSDNQGHVIQSLNVELLPPLPAPIITSLTPAEGPIGTVITLMGSSLIDVTAVAFNGTAAPGFVLRDAGTRLEVTVPTAATSGFVTATTDEAGTAISPVPFTVTVPVPVLITATTPRPNASNVPLAATVSASFVAPVTAATAGNLRVFGNQLRGRRPGTVSGGGTSTLTFDPTQDFAPGEQVSVSWPATLRAADGNQVRPQVVQFTTATGGTGQLNYATETPLSLPQPGEPALADIDNDGDLDLLVLNTSIAGEVSIRLNNGQGGFSPAPAVAVGTGYLNLLRVADLDGDGDLDLLTASSSARVADVWLNSGRATFSSAGTVSGSVNDTQTIRDMVLGDVDADGDLDVTFVTNEQVQVRLNNGAGSFSGSYGFYLTSANRTVVPTHLALGDVDADGDLDILVAASNSDYALYVVKVVLNNGAGQFADSQEVPFLAGPTRVNLGDLDGDGDLDMTVKNTVNYNARISIRLNNGTGTFTGNGEVSLAGAGPALADADADGDLDIVMHNAIGLNNGAGGFAAVLPITSSTAFPWGIALGDIDGDQDLDLVTSLEGNTVMVRFNRLAPPPTLSSLLPGSGPVGSPVLLRGSNLVGTRTVTFNGVAATSFAVVSATELVATVPVAATTGPVVLTTPAGSATSATPFVVTLPIDMLSAVPARNAANAPRSAAVSVTFARPIGSSSAANLRVFGARTRGRRPGTISGGGSNSLTFTPAQAFAPGEEISVSLPATMAGTTAGNVRPHVYQFTAAAGGTGTAYFPTTTNVPIYYRAISMAAGDLDNDGDQDLLSADGSVRLNNGSGAFTAGATVALGPDPLQVVLADLNADGNLDALTCHGVVRLNTGNGTFTNLPNFGTASAVPRDLAVGDLDADGDLDVVVAKNGTDSLYLSYNDGTGRFPFLQRLAVGTRPAGVAIGDVDNDGDLDILASTEGYSSNGSGVSVCFNNGIGLFTRVVQLPVGSFNTRLAVGDLDADGDLDLVTGSGFVCFNDGTGTFSGTQTVPLGLGLALGDLDADGDLDLVINGSTTSVHLNTGQGTFTTAPALGFERTWTGLVLTDFDGDGDLDVAATHSAENRIMLSLNERIAPPIIRSFSPASGLAGSTVVLTGTDLIGVTSVTFNGIVAPGFVVNSATQITVTVPAAASSGLLSVTNARGTGISATPYTVLAPVAVLSVSPIRNATAPRTAPISVTFAQSIPTNNTANLAVFSARRGGRLVGTRAGAGSSTLTFTPTQAFQPGEKLSISIPAYTEPNQRRVQKQVYQFQAAVGGAGRGYFAAPITATLSEPMAEMLPGDVDGDGSLDLLVHDGSTVSVLRNNGSGGFSRLSAVAAPFSTSPTMVLGDIDGDGDLDLAAGGSGGNTVSMLFNNGTATFGGPQELTVGDNPQSLALADLDGDGDLDLATANQGATSCTVSIRFNDGTGRFSGTTDTFLSTGTNVNFSNMEIGDVDSDGDLDIVIANDRGYILLNDGLGELTTTVALLNNIDSHKIHLADMDADGDLDVLAFTNSSTGGQPSRVRLYRNSGTGTFTSSDLVVGIDTNDMSVGDVDADGDPDLLIVGDFTVPGEVWLNNGQGSFSRLLTLDLGLSFVLPLLTDVDNDGDLDLLGSNYYTPTDLSVRLNGSTPPPTITSFSPTSGPEATTVVVTGSGLLGTTAVRFNGRSAPGFIVNSPTQLTVRVPAGATTGPISVVTAVSTAVSVPAFTVLPLAGVVGLMPRANSTAASRSASISLGLGAPVTAATAGNLRVFGSQLRGRRPGTVSGSGTSTLTFDPAQDFAPGEQISVSVPAALQTTVGGLVRRQVYQFTAATGGPGRGAFRPGTDVPVGRFAFSLALGDLDNDGDLDVLTPTESGSAFSIGVQLNNGQARFSTGTSIIPGSFTTITQVVLGDVDGDGDLDVLASFGNSRVSICLNNGNATFAPARYLDIACNRFALGDLDADGDLDLVASSYQSGTLSVGLNDGTGLFLPQLPVLTSPTALTVVLTDADSDGDLDALTCNDTNGVYFFRNDGDASLSPATVLAVPGSALGLALADADADGDLDLAVAYNENAASDGRLSLFYNNGTGNLVASGRPIATGRYTSQVLFGDVDHDGDPDLAAINGSSDDVSIRLNDGTGTFFGTPTIAVHDNPIQMALGDLDADGDLDIVVTQATSGSTFVDVRLNDGQALSALGSRAGMAGLLVYPNPAHGQFTIRVPHSLRPTALQPEATLQLYDAVGKLVLEQKPIISADGELTVTTEHLPPGLYSLHLSFKQQHLMGKIMLE